MKLSKRSLALLILGLAILIFIGWYLWYTAPVTLEEVFLSSGWEEMPDGETMLLAQYWFYEKNEQPGGAPVRYECAMNIPRGDPALEEFFSLVKDVPFRRALLRMSGSHAIQPGDSSIHLTFGGTNEALLMYFWFDEFYIRLVDHETEYHCSLDGFNEIKAQVETFILEHGTEPERFE